VYHADQGRGGDLEQGEHARVRDRERQRETERDKKRRDKEREREREYDGIREGGRAAGKEVTVGTCHRAAASAADTAVMP
jgi:hypothetical protein